MLCSMLVRLQDGEAVADEVALARSVLLSQQQGSWDVIRRVDSVTADVDLPLAAFQAW